MDSVFAFVGIAVLFLAVFLRGAVALCRDVQHFVSGFFQFYLAKRDPVRASAAQSTQAPPVQAPPVHTPSVSSVPETLSVPGAARGQSRPGRRSMRQLEPVTAVWLPKSLTHAHISEQCQGLNFADRSSLTSYQLCSHCVRELADRSSRVSQ